MSLHVIYVQHEEKYEKTESCGSRKTRKNACAIIVTLIVYNPEAVNSSLLSQVWEQWKRSTY